ncbi:reverse transcriptase/maturase family protein [Fusobacterium sp.]|uniref:reverse transcriptase/maturase family protein n=1 Tax=Fusobacterium sp. TaxID=68766 RepID=UPI002635AF0E|nr:reverse transcriptase/maturase family protein [Fusobacterium sp.]
MKRVNNLYEQIYDFENIYDAYLKARKCKRFRQEVLEYSMNIEENLITLQNELIWGLYKQGEYREFYVYVPKVRLIKALPFKDRVLQHAVNNIIEPLFEAQFYEHSYACRKGKGGHKASEQLKNWLHAAKVQGKELYCLKCDIRKYFDSVYLKILYGILRKKIKDKKLLWLIRQILDIHTKERGLPIGNLTSQLFANVYLNQLDIYVKEELKVKKYIRYMDDFLILSEDKKELQEILKKIITFLEEKLKLSLNDKTRIFPVKMGVEFVGYIHYADFIKVRKSTWKREKKNIKKVAEQYKNGEITIEKLQNVFASILGHLSHADSFQTRVKIVEYERNLAYKYEKKEDDKV